MTVIEARVELETLKVQDLAGKNAVVTGATRGIGRAIALNLALRGASIIGTCSASSSLHHIDSLREEVAKAYRHSGLKAPRVIGLSANVVSLETPAVLSDAIQKHFNATLHILVNNAAYDELRPIGMLDDEYVQRCLTGNIHNLVMTMEAILKGGHLQPNSRVINISSVSGRKIPFPAMYLVGATKATMEAITRTWADFLGTNPATKGTTVNALLVGATATESLLQTAPPEIKQRAVEAIKTGAPIMGPTGMGRVEDVADVAGLIASESARWITGGVVCANGGYLNIL